MAKKSKANPMKPQQGTESMRFISLRAARPPQNARASDARLLPCEAGTSAASMVREAVHPKARPTVLGSMDTTASRLGSSGSS